MNKFYCGLVAAAALAFSASASANLVLDATNYAQSGSDPVFVGQLTPGSAAQIEGLLYVTTNYSGIQLTEVYKQNVGGSEEGSFAGSYNTTFSNSNGDADIVFDGAPDPTISGYPILVFAKDGNNDPFWYLWDITGQWDGQEQIEINGLWPNQGAISHVSILTGPGGDVPEPGIVTLFGVGLLGLAAARRRRAS